jgi:hypothetical protein
MDTSTIITILIGICILVGLVFVYNKYIKIHVEGFELPNGAYNANKNVKILEETNKKIRDTVLIDTYFNDYENIVKEMDTYLDNMMLEQLLKVDTSQVELTDYNFKLFSNINTLNVSKDNLNRILKFLDKQS